MVGSRLTPVDAFTGYEADREASMMIKGTGADGWYLGSPRRKVGQIVQTRDELWCDRIRVVPNALRRLWHRMFPIRSWYQGVYIEIDETETPVLHS